MSRETISLSRTLDLVVAANGVYDILCATAILAPPRSGWASAAANLHMGMYTRPPGSATPTERRLMAYWLVSYGTVRVVQCTGDASVSHLSAVTYFIEMAAWLLEYGVYNTVHGGAAMQVAGLCMVFGVMCAARPYVTEYRI